MANGSGLFSDEGPLKPHLLRGGGVGGEVADLRRDVGDTVTPMTAMTVDEHTNVATADTDAIVAVGTASVAGATTLSGAALDGVLGSGTMDPARNVSITTSDSAATWAAQNVVFTGTDVNDQPISETIAIANNATTAGTSAFASVTSVVMNAVDAAGTYGLGFGILMGLNKLIVARAGLTGLIREIETGVLVTTGTIAASAAGLPNGTYDAANPPNATRDYAIYYEYDPTA